MKRAAIVCLGALLLASACQKATPKAHGPIRLVDLYKPDPQPSGAAGPAKEPTGTAWSFVAAPPAAPAAGQPAKPAPPFEAGPGVLDLSVKGGHLVGRTTAALPIVDLRRPRSEDRDVLHEVQIRMRASAGTSVSVILRP